MRPFVTAFFTAVAVFTVSCESIPKPYWGGVSVTLLPHRTGRYRYASPMSRHRGFFGFQHTPVLPHLRTSSGRTFSSNRAGRLDSIYFVELTACGCVRSAMTSAARLGLRRKPSTCTTAIISIFGLRIHMRPFIMVRLAAGTVTRALSDGSSRNKMQPNTYQARAVKGQEGDVVFTVVNPPKPTP